MNVDVQYALLPLIQLHAWPHNPRRTFSDSDLAELADSIRQVGVIEPLVARRAVAMGGETTEYEVIAGERRLRAAALAGVVRVPVRVVDLTDADALELALTENSQRVDVSPLEEAVAVARLIRHHGRPVGAVAARLGRTPAWVRARVRLAEAPESVIGLWRDGRVSTRSVHAVLACAPDVQLSVVEYLAATAHHQGWRYADVLRVIEHRTRRLDAAPWPLHDGTLPGGACTGCPRRSGAQIDLWTAEKDRCLDTACWTEKDVAWWERRQGEVTAAGGATIELEKSWSPSELVHLDEPADEDVAEAVGLQTAAEAPPTWGDVLEHAGATAPTSIVRRPATFGGAASYDEGVRLEDLAQGLALAGAYKAAAVARGDGAEDSSDDEEGGEQDAELEAGRCMAWAETVWDGLSTQQRLRCVLVDLYGKRVKPGCDPWAVARALIVRRARYNAGVRARLEELAAEPQLDGGDTCTRPRLRTTWRGTARSGLLGVRMDRGHEG